MRVAIKTASGTIYSRDYLNKTYEQVKRIEAEYMRRRGWEEVAEVTGISQFKIIPEGK